MLSNIKVGVIIGCKFDNEKEVGLNFHIGDCKVGLQLCTNEPYLYYFRIKTK